MNLGDRFDIFLSLQEKDDRMFSDDLNKELKLLQVKLTTVVQRTGGKDTKLPRLRVTFAVQSVSYCWRHGGYFTCQLIAQIWKVWDCCRKFKLGNPRPPASSTTFPHNVTWSAWRITKGWATSNINEYWSSSVAPVSTGLQEWVLKLLRTFDRSSTRNSV